MANDSPLDIDRFRGRLWLLAEIELSPRLKVKEDPSDIVQQSLLEAHRDLHTYRGQTDAELYSWLRTILSRNLLSTAGRYGTKKRDTRREHSMADRLEQSSMRIEKLLPSDQSSPSQQAMQNEQSEQLVAGLAKLLDGERTAIVLKYFQDWKLPQISEHLGRPPDAIAGLLKRGLKKLRLRLQPDTE